MKIQTLLCAALLLLIAGTVSAQKNLVANPGFEDELNDWNNGNSAKVTPWDYKGGKNSCAIIVTNANGWVGIDQTIRLPKNTLGLEIAAWVKTNNVLRGKDEWMGAIYNLEFLDRADKKVGEGVSVAHLTGDNDWQLATKQVKVPAGAVSFKVMVAMSYASGTMLVDDVTVKVLNAEAVAKL